MRKSRTPESGRRRSKRVEKVRLLKTPEGRKKIEEMAKYNAENSENQEPNFGAYLMPASKSRPAGIENQIDRKYDSFLPRPALNR